MAMRVAAIAAVFATLLVGSLVLSPTPASAGWCAYNDGSEIVYQDGFSRIGGPSRCEEDFDGSWMSNRAYNRISNPPSLGGLLPPLHPIADFPDGWFESIGVCATTLPITGEPLQNTAGLNNRLEDVYALRAQQLAAEIAYDIGSNEVTGVLGAILGTVLGFFKTDTFAMEWTYDVQDECQEIVARNTIQSIHVDTQSLVADVQAILAKVDVAVSTRASQTSVDAVNVKVMAISTALANVAGSLTTETDEIDAGLAALNVRLTTETDEIDAALVALDTSLTTETDEIDDAIAALAAQLGMDQDQNVLLYLEDHLETCRQTASLLLSDDDGLLPLVVIVVEDFVDRADAEGFNIGNARSRITQAERHIAAGSPGIAFQSLCDAYRQILNG